MKNIILYSLGSVTIIVVSGALTFFTLNALNPKDDTVSTNSPTSTSPEASTPVPEVPAQETPLPVPTQQDDTAVKNMLSSLSAAVEMYRANNRGAYPDTEASFEKFKESYVEEELTNPTTKKPYAFLLNAPQPSASVITLQIGHVCSEDNTATFPQAGNGTMSKYALSVFLPTGATYCTGS